MKVTVTRSHDTYLISSSVRDIFLTAEEVAAIRSYAHVELIRSGVEYAVKRAVDDGVVSFETWASCPFCEYSSEDDAREDFIDAVAESIVEHDELYDRNPSHTDEELYDAVIETASDFEFIKE